MSPRTTALLLLPAVAVIVVLLVSPLLYLLGYGFLDTEYGQERIDGFTLAHYQKVLSDPFYLAIFAKTLMLSAVNTAIVTVFGYALAHFIWRQRRWRALFISIALSPLLVSI